ncbi:MAG: septum site-determining protein MinD [Eubacteriales bacterium]|nr:septum site-determining protein MinD [Eubacteriales bacterium]MDD4390048.1 septum site-determining protein MinD [Eubacteriales bacterium]
MGKTILIASGKGGTGKSVVASNLGAVLAMDGHSVVMLDMDMGMRNLDLYMGMENRAVYNVCDVLNGVCRIKQALIKDKRFNNLYLMAASPRRLCDNVTPLHMKVLCDKLREKFEYIIIDGPAGIDDGLILAAAGADIAIIVTVPEFAAARDAQTVSVNLNSIGIKKRMYLLNNVKANLLGRGVFPSISDIDEMLKIPPAGIIQHDENINIAANSGLPIVFKKDTYIHKNFKKIAFRIISEQ